MKKIISIVFLSFLFSAIFAWENATILRENDTLWRKNSTGSMYWENNVSRSVPAGTIIQINPEGKVSAPLISKSSNNSFLTFYPAKFDNTDYYVLTGHVAKGTTLAVLYQDAVLYTRPKLSSFRNATLEAGTIAVTGSSITQNNVEFMEISFFDSQAGYVKTRFVLTSKISNYPNDIQAARILEKIQNSDSEGIKRELISNAIDLETTEPMKELIQKEYRKIFSGETEQAIKKTIMSLPDKKMIIISPDGESLFLHELPDPKSNGTSLISDNSIVIATQKTQEKENIDGINENWYFIANEKVSGWIFGNYLAPYSGNDESISESENQEEILY